MTRDWHFEHDYRHSVSFAQLIDDGVCVKELSVDGEGHAHRISDAVADWEIEQEDARLTLEAAPTGMRNVA
jgi:hypothetical protein